MCAVLAPMNMARERVHISSVVTSPILLSSSVHPTQLLLVLLWLKDLPPLADKIGQQAATSDPDVQKPVWAEQRK